MSKLFLPRHGRTHSSMGSDPIPLHHTLLIVFDGSGTPLTTGIKGDVQLHNLYRIGGGR